MFKNMMKNKKAWDEFCIWLKEKYNIICTQTFENVDLKKIKSGEEVEKYKTITFRKWYDVIYGAIPDDFIIAMMYIYFSDNKDTIKLLKLVYEEMFRKQEILND